MKTQLYALFLITLSILDFSAIASFNLVQAMYAVGQSITAIMAFVGVAIAVGVLGFVMLIGKN